MAWSSRSRVVARCLGHDITQTQLLREQALCGDRSLEAAFIACGSLPQGFPAQPRTLAEGGLLASAKLAEEAKQEELRKGLLDLGVAWGLVAVCCAHHVGHFAHAMGCEPRQAGQSLGCQAYPCPTAIRTGIPHLNKVLLHGVSAQQSQSQAALGTWAPGTAPNSSMV